MHNAVGGVGSKSVKKVVHVLLLLLASLTVTVIVVVPVPTTAPAAGLWVMTNNPVGVQLSVASTSLVTFGNEA